MKRLLSLTLALLLTLSVLNLMSCTANSDLPVDPGTTDPGTTDPGTTDPGDNPGVADVDYLLQVPQEDYSDYGEPYTILGRPDYEYEMYVEEEDAVSLLEEGVFARNARVEEYLGVEITYFPVAGSWNDQKQFTATVQQAVATNDNSFQMVSAYMAYNCNLVLNDLYFDLHSLENPMLDAEWWINSWVKNSTVNGRLYNLIGDLSLSMWRGIQVMFFNRDMANDLDLGDLYQMVRDGEWTIEELAMLTETLYVDDGDDEVDAEDTFAFAAENGFVRVMSTACELPITEPDGLGFYNMAMMSEENAARTQDVWDLMYELFFNTPGLTHSKLNGGVDSYDIFTDNRALLLNAGLHTTDRLRDSEIKYGILPVPKWNQEQTDYHTHCSDNASTFSIPLCCSDPEMSARVLDALSAENKCTVIPSYYEVVLKGRVAQDEESAEMLDFMRERIYFDFGFIYSCALYGNDLAGPYAYFGDSMFVFGHTSFASAWAKVEELYQEKLDAILNYFTKTN